MLEGKLAYWNLSENSISVSSGRNGSWESFVSWYLPKGSFLDLRTDVLGGGTEGGIGGGWEKDASCLCSEFFSV